VFIAAVTFGKRTSFARMFAGYYLCLRRLVCHRLQEKPIHLCICCQPVEDNAFRLAAPERLTQVGFSLLENTLLVPGQIFPGAVDVKIQHRHR